MPVGNARVIMPEQAMNRFSMKNPPLPGQQIRRSGQLYDIGLPWGIVAIEPYP